MQKNSTLKIARAGIISALYVVLSLVVFPFASGAIQVRLGEALCLLPLFFSEACVSLFVGCIIVNVITGCAIFDIVLGSLITLSASILTFIVGKKIKNLNIKVFVGGAFPILLNAFLLPLIWFYCYGEMEYVYFLQVLLIFVGQAVSVYGIGSVLAFPLSKNVDKLNKK